MSPQNTGRWLDIDKSALQERVRKTAIALLLFGSLLPALFVNIGLNAKEAGWSGPLSKLNQGFYSFRALLLCQHWTLFSYIPPFNFKMHFEVELKDGRVVRLRDFKKERAGKWQPLLFHNERKAVSNLYRNRPALRQYVEYLIRTNGLDPAQVVRRTIHLRYQNVLPRDQATLAGTYFGPETNHVFDSY